MGGRGFVGEVVVGGEAQVDFQVRVRIAVGAIVDPEREDQVGKSVGRAAQRVAAKAGARQSLCLATATRLRVVSFFIFFVCRGGGWVGQAGPG